MATVSTSTQATPFGQPSLSFIDRRGSVDFPHPSDGNLYAMIKNTAGNYELFQSINNGSTWTSKVTLTRANVIEFSSIHIDITGRLHWAYRTNESSQDRIYARHLTSDYSAWSAETLVNSAANGGVAGAVFQGVDIVTVSPRHTYVMHVIGTTIGASTGITLSGKIITDTGNFYADNSFFIGRRQWLATGSGRITPSVDMEHIGDGKQSGTGHVWISWGRTSLFMVKVVWTGVAWNGPHTAQTIYTGITAQDCITGRWTGQEWVMTVPNPTVGATDTLLLFERDKSNTRTIQRTTPVHPTGVVKNCAISYNRITRDIRIFAVGTSTTVLYYVDYIRATGLWSSWTVVLATAIIGTNGTQYSVRRGTFGNARQDVLTAHSTPTQIHTSQLLTYAPNIPTWINITGQSADVNAALLLDWEFSDPDTADTQSAYTLARQIGAGAFEFWRASDSTWQVAEVKNISSTTQLSLASGWGAASDANHAYAVKVWDSADIISLWSVGVTVVPSTKVNPTVTSPTAAQVLTGDSLTVTWTVSEQTAFKIRLQISSLVVFDSGWIAGTDLTYTPDYVLLDSTSYSIFLQTKNLEGLSSNEVQRDFSVDYLEPEIPTLVATAIPASGVIRVVITNPTPTGGRPALLDQDVYRREVSSGAAGDLKAIGLASAATYDDWTAVSGVAYEYRVLARGVNGTSVFGAWTA